MILFKAGTKFVPPSNHFVIRKDQISHPPLFVLNIKLAIGRRLRNLSK